MKPKSPRRFVSFLGFFELFGFLFFRKSFAFFCYIRTIHGGLE